MSALISKKNEERGVLVSVDRTQLSSTLRIDQLVSSQKDLLHRARRLLREKRRLEGRVQRVDAVLVSERSRPRYATATRRGKPSETQGTGAGEILITAP